MSKSLLKRVQALEEKLCLTEDQPRTSATAIELFELSVKDHFSLPGKAFYGYLGPDGVWHYEWPSMQKRWEGFSWAFEFFQKDGK